MNNAAKYEFIRTGDRKIFHLAGNTDYGYRIDSDNGPETDLIKFHASDEGGSYYVSDFSGQIYYMQRVYGTAEIQDSEGFVTQECDLHTGE